MQFSNYIMLSFLFFNCHIANTQITYGIKSIQGVYIEKLPGNIPVDENGNSLFKGPDTLITIYVETSGKEPEWKMAWRGNKNYSITSSLISQKRYEVGTTMKDNKKIILSPAAGNKLWQLTLQLNNKKIKLPQKLKIGELLIKGKYKGKDFYIKNDTLVQLSTHPSV